MAWQPHKTRKYQYYKRQVPFVLWGKDTSFAANAISVLLIKIADEVNMIGIWHHCARLVLLEAKASYK
jgi:hypothetical protein